MSSSPTARRAACQCALQRFPHHYCQWTMPLDWESLHLSEVPRLPGFYAFTDYPDETLRPTRPNARVLYVGQAFNLQDRMRTYKLRGRSAFGHRGATHLLTSHLSAVSASGAGDAFVLERHRQTREVEVYRKGEPPTKLRPSMIFVRWAVDYREAIEAYLIEELRPLFNTVHAPREG